MSVALDISNYEFCSIKLSNFEISKIYTIRLLRYGNSNIYLFQRLYSVHVRLNSYRFSTITPLIEEILRRIRMICISNLQPSKSIFLLSLQKIKIRGDTSSQSRASNAANKFLPFCFFLMKCDIN